MRHVHEASEMIQFTLHVRVVRAHVAFTAAPEHVVFATQFIGDFESLLDLSTGVCEYVRVRACGGSVHVARM